MAIVMTKDGKVRPFQVSDLKEVAERDERIKQLSRLNATLAGEVDRQRLLCDITVIVAAEIERVYGDVGWAAGLRDAVRTLRSQSGGGG